MVRYRSGGNACASVHQESSGAPRSTCTTSRPRACPVILPSAQVVKMMGWITAIKALNLFEFNLILFNGVRLSSTSSVICSILMYRIEVYLHFEGHFVNTLLCTSSTRTLETIRVI